MKIKKVSDLTSFNKELSSYNGTTLLKFEADWCMPCKAMNAVVEEIAKHNPDIKVLAIDIEGEGMDEVIKRFKISSLPTFIKLNNGDLEACTRGTLTKAELSTFLKAG